MRSFQLRKHDSLIQNSGKRGYTEIRHVSMIRSANFCFSLFAVLGWLDWLFLQNNIGLLQQRTAYTTKTLSRRVSLEHRECGSELRHAETQNMQSRNKSQMDEFYVVRKPRKIAFRLSKPRFYTASDSQTVEAKNVQILRTKILRKQNIKTSGNEQQKAKLRTLQSCEHVYQKLSSALPCLAFFGNYRHKVKTYMIMKRDKYQNLLFENDR